MAAHHIGTAAGIEDQLARSIFSDDPNAVEALEAKASEIDARCEMMKKANAAYWKGGLEAFKALALAGVVTSGIVEEGLGNLRAWVGVYSAPFPSYALSNARAKARAARERIKEVERRKQADAATEEAGGLLITRGDAYCSVRFSEKPSREVLEALRAAFFNYSGGAWSGPIDRLPACVVALEGQP